MERGKATMHLRRHETAECPSCGSLLWYGLKAETAGWKVYYECVDCWFEKRVGRVVMADVESHNDAVKRALEMGNRL